MEFEIKKGQGKGSDGKGYSWVWKEREGRVMVVGGGWKGKGGEEITALEKDGKGGSNGK